jgi:regulator of RNase E activity RraA
MSTIKDGKAVLTSEELEPFRHMNASLLANAIEFFHNETRREGFVDSSVRCLFPRLPRLVGYAVTVKVRRADPPAGGGLFPDRSDWWDYFMSRPEPRVAVVEDCSGRIGVSSLLGVAQINVLRVFGCIGAVTNGAVRDIPEAEAMRFPLFAGSVSVSHAHVEMVDMGGSVDIGGLKIRPGELLHGDIHGVQSIPPEIAARLPDVAMRIASEEEALISLSRSPDFSLEKLQAAVASLKH